MARSTDITYEQRIEIIQRIVDGNEGSSKVAKEYQLPHSSVINWVNDYKATGHIRRPKGQGTREESHRVFSDAEKEHVIAMIRDGSSYQQIAEIYRVKSGKIWNIVQKYRRRTGDNPLPEHKQEMVRNNGKTIKPVVHQTIEELLSEYISNLNQLVKMQVLTRVRGL